MKYLDKQFTVPMGSQNYREGYDKIDWSEKPDEFSYMDELINRIFPEEKDIK